MKQQEIYGLFYKKRLLAALPLSGKQLLHGMARDDLMKHWNRVPADRLHTYSGPVTFATFRSRYVPLGYRVSRILVTELVTQPHKGDGDGARR